MRRREQMIGKTFLGRIVIIGLAVCIGLPALGIFAQSQNAEPKPGSHKVIAYYFHTNTR